MILCANCSELSWQCVGSAKKTVWEEEIPSKRINNVLLVGYGSVSNQAKFCQGLTFLVFFFPFKPEQFTFPEIETQDTGKLNAITGM